MKLVSTLWIEVQAKSQGTYVSFCSIKDLNTNVKINNNTETPAAPEPSRIAHL
jgi:hypothetical protein